MRKFLPGSTSATVSEKSFAAQACPDPELFQIEAYQQALVELKTLSTNRNNIGACFLMALLDKDKGGKALEHFLSRYVASMQAPYKRLELLGYERGILKELLPRPCRMEYENLSRREWGGAVCGIFGGGMLMGCLGSQETNADVKIAGRMRGKPLSETESMKFRVSMGLMGAAMLGGGGLTHSTGREQRQAFELSKVHEAMEALCSQLERPLLYYASRIGHTHDAYRDR